MNKRGLGNSAQLTLFVIFGIIVVVGIIALFMLLPTPEFLQGTSAKDPIQETRSCISTSLSEVLPEFLEKGLYFDSANSLVYQDHVVAYHCYTYEKKQICLRNDAQSKARIEEELKNKISSKVEICFDSYRNANKGADIEMGETNLGVEILPGKITIKINKEVVISRGEGEEPERYNRFDVSLNSPLWDFIRMSNEILNEEVSCNCPSESCTADITELMRANRDYKVSFFIGGRDEKVYTIEDYYGENIFNFAVKNCDKTP